MREGREGGGGGDQANYGGKVEKLVPHSLTISSTPCAHDYPWRRVGTVVLNAFLPQRVTARGFTSLMEGLEVLNERHFHSDNFACSL